MSDESPLSEKRSPGRLFLPSLTLSNFATGPIGVLTGLLLIDISVTFGCSVGVMGQITTGYYIAAVIFGLFMGVLSVRFRHKSLLMVGLVFTSVSALGCYLASDFNLMLMAYSLSGVGMAMVWPMTISLTGEHLPLEKRGNAIGWIVAGGALSYVIGAPIIGFIARLGDWRSVLLVFIIPISLASLLLAFIGLPSASGSLQPTTSKGTYLESFKEILSNRSAVACLVGSILRSIAWMVILVYGISFFRERFLKPEGSEGSASVIILVAALLYTLGSLICGRFLNRFGRKPLTVLATLLAGIFTISFTFVPNLWLSLALNFLGCWFGGMGFSAISSLTLEQVPKFRGTMMSINSAAMNLGSALGAALGGLTLILFDYEVLGLSLGAMGVVAAIVFQTLAIDPTKT